MWKTLLQVEPGEVVQIGDRKYIVLEQMGTQTSLITKKSVKNMIFGDVADYSKSDIRKYLNGEFYHELCDAVGSMNVVSHTVDLMAVDGTGKKKACQDNVSLLSAELYRKYSELILPAASWWLATPYSYRDGYMPYACFANSVGVLSWSRSAYSNGVRPFCILDSYIFVS